jgi:hypothetical protein
MIFASTLAPLLLALQGVPAPAPQALASFPVTTIDGQTFPSWQAYAASDAYRPGGLRCLTPFLPGDDSGVSAQPPNDCGYQTTTPKVEYQPTFTYDIPVVVHVLRSLTGQGNVPAALVQSQIDILNEDFQAMAGTNGAPGNNGKIRFHLATVDPGGSATTGITYTDNDL